MLSKLPTGRMYSIGFAITVPQIFIFVTMTTILYFLLSSCSRRRQGELIILLVHFFAFETRHEKFVSHKNR